MSVKEKPLLDAAEKLGPLPGWLFANAFAAGLVALLMVPVFGAVFAIFWSTLSAPDAAEMFEAAMFGAVGAVAFATLIVLGVAFSAFVTPDERAPRLLFTAGAFVSIALFFTLTVLFYEDARLWLEVNDPPMWTGDV